MYTGPKLINDNLVFGYDTGHGVAHNAISTRFFKGKPTENMLTLAGDNVDLERSGGAPSYSYHGKNITSYIQSRWTSSNNVIVQSFEGKRDYVGGGTGGGNDGYPRMYVYFTDWSWSSSFGITTYDWSYGRQIFTMPDPTGKSVVMSIYHMNSQNPGRSYSRKQSVSFNSIDIPYINGSRSDTASLIDLKKTTDIDVGNVSFDSTGQPTFDGSDDYIYIDKDILNVLGFTVEAIVNITSTGNYNKPIFTCGNLSSTGIWFLKHRSGLGNRLVMHGYDGVNPRIDVQSTNAVPDAENTHVAVTFNGTSYQIYINGVADGNSVSDNAIGASSDNYIGRQGSTYLLGDVPLLKIYNAALSAAEIKSNYNAYKNRFNI
tara:strand:- start:1 stop:1122 length:1122 start_codon:yes stop_codon:yes gene_type:complete